MKKNYLFLIPLLSLTLVSFSYSITKGATKIEKYAPPNSGGPAANGNQDRTGSPLSSGNCATCHSGGAFQPTIDVFITDTMGNQVTAYTPGEDYIIEYFMLNSSGTPFFGMQSVILSPAAGNPDAGTMVSVITPGSHIVSSGGRNYYEHSTPDPIGVFQMRWTAPAAGFGDVNIYASGNAVNGNGGTSGDESTAPFVYTFQEACVPTSSTDTQVACDSFTWIDGTTYTASNTTATYVETNGGGCDSTITLDLTINTVNSAVSLTGITVSADEAGASYQWIDCGSGNAISGATGQDYTATANGDYAVIVTDNGCSDTSVCTTVSQVGIVENSFGSSLEVAPNPTNGNFSIDLGASHAHVIVTLTNLNGEVIQSTEYADSQLLQMKLEEPVGMYLLLIQSDDKKAVIRMVKN